MSQTPIDRPLGDQAEPAAPAFLRNPSSFARAAIEPVPLAPTGLTPQQTEQSRQHEKDFGTLGSRQLSISEQLSANLGHVLTGTTGPNPERDGQRRADALIQRTAETGRIMSVAAFAVTSGLVPLNLAVGTVRGMQLASGLRSTTERPVQGVIGNVVDGITRIASTPVKPIIP